MPDEHIVNSIAWHIEIWLAVSHHTNYGTIHKGNEIRWEDWVVAIPYIVLIRKAPQAVRLIFLA